MIVRIELCSFLRRYLPSYDPAGGFELRLADEATVRDALEALGIPPEEASVIMINRIASNLDGRLEEGDGLGVFAAASGG